MKFINLVSKAIIIHGLVGKMVLANFKIATFAKKHQYDLTFQFDV